MNSEQRRAARRKRREEKRARAKAERVKACTLETVADLNSLCKASKQAARGVMWKASTQRYMKDYLRNAVKSRQDLLEGRDICRGFIRFDLWERGKLRHISAVHFPERVVQKSLSQNALVPAIVPTLVSANSANIKGRGTDYALKLLKRHLADHWRRHGREGYILLGDFSDYFARIAHEPVKRQVADALLDPRVVALEHRLIDAQGEVGLGLGSEPNQICAVAHPNRIDHYVAEMLRPEAYGRYMDDFYLIHESKEYLQVCLLLIEHECAKLGIALNPRKTRVVKLTRGFTWLKKRIFYTETGRIVMKPCRDSITRERRKLKKMARMVADGVMTPEQVERSYQSWRGGMKRLDAHRSVLAMDALYRSLFENLARERGAQQHLAVSGRDTCPVRRFPDIEPDDGFRHSSWCHGGILQSVGRSEPLSATPTLPGRGACARQFPISRPERRAPPVATPPGPSTGQGQTAIRRRPIGGPSGLARIVGNAPNARHRNLSVAHFRL